MTETEADSLLKECYTRIVATAGENPTHLFCGEEAFDSFKNSAKKLNLTIELDNRIAPGIFYMGPKMPVNKALELGKNCDELS